MITTLTHSADGHRQPGASFHPRLLWRGFALIEVLVAVGVFGILIVALFSGMTFGFGVIRVTQENLRATQIMVEKLESIRLCTWEQLNTPGFVPRKFAALYYDGVSNANGSLTYSGTVTVSNAPPSESYATDLRFVTVDLAWTSGQSTRQRSMTAMISQYGIQNYKY